MLAAEKLCRARGVRFTAARRRLLGILEDAGRPMRAYELMARFGAETGQPVQPPTIYRALDFLISQHLVARIETRSTYVLCAHPDRPHDCIFFVCDSCGESREVDSTSIDEVVARDAHALGFQVSRRVVELQGTCARCLNEAATGAPGP